MSVAFFETTGKCLGIVDGNGEIPDAAASASVPHGTSPNSIWYDGAEVQPKTPFEVQVSPNTVSGIPAGTEAVLTSSVVVVDDGTLELEVDYAQTVRVTLLHPRHYETSVGVPCEVQA